MGNNTAQWRATYDLNLHSREVQAAVDDSAQWREAMLAPSRKRRRAVVEEESEWEESEEDSVWEDSGAESEWVDSEEEEEEGE